MTLQLPDLAADTILSVDTETSGLHVDDGARVSVVSMAWWDAWPASPQSIDSRGVKTQVFAFDHGYDTPLGPKHVDLSKFAIKTRKQMTPSLFDVDIDAAPNLPPDDYYELMEWLMQFPLSFFNAKFDLHILDTGLRGMESRTVPDLSRQVIWDGLVVNPVLWPEFPSQALKSTCGRLYGIEETRQQQDLEKWLKGHGKRYDLAPWSLMEPYAGQDANLTHRLYETQLDVIESGEIGTPHTVQTVCEREVDLAIALYRMERRGLGYNSEKSLDEAERLYQAAHTAEQNFCTQQQHEFPERYPTIRSVPRLTEHTARAFWFNKRTDSPPGLGIPVIRETDGGAASVAKEVVRELIEREAPGAVDYEAYNKCTTAASMWYSGWAKLAGPPDRNHHADLDERWPRLRTNYRQSRTQEDRDEGGTISGRLAVQRLQLQAVPHDYQLPVLDPPLVSVRELMVPDPGFVLWELDISQAEFRVAAGVSNCKKMTAAMQDDGWDAHDSTTMEVFHIDKSHHQWSFYRNVGKRLGFGMIYGAGAETIRRQVEQYTGQRPTTGEMDKWLKAFRGTYPELGRASRRAELWAERRRRVPLAGGRDRWFSPYEPTHKAFNAQIQGGVAEMMKVAMIDVEASHPGIMLLQIHDSIVVEIRPDAVDQLIPTLQRRIAAPFEEAFSVPFRVDAKQWN